MRFLLILTAFLLCFCSREKKNKTSQKQISDLSLVILGTVQDGGSPHAGCKKRCCRALFEKPDPKRKVVSLGLIDRKNRKSWLFEASPDLPTQLKLLKKISGNKDGETPDGIFLTHAHIGHYTGLMFLGREAMNAKDVKVFAMPCMKEFIETNGPWSQLVSLQNISLQLMKEDSAVVLSPQLKVIPFTVPHRDEYSETVGYRIESPTKKVLFIPDIDKWQKWDRNIVNELAGVDYALIDGTFFGNTELNNRKMSEIPHPFVKESMLLFDTLAYKEKQKVHFIHFNHTNPLLNKNSAEHATVLKAGFRIAEFESVLEL